MATQFAGSVVMGMPVDDVDAASSPAVQHCALNRTVIATILTSEQQPSSLLPLAESALAHGFPCLVVQPFDAIVPSAAAKSNALFLLPPPNPRLYPRSRWCNGSDYISRRTQLHRLKMWHHVLRQNLNVLGVDSSKHRLVHNPLPAIAAMRTRADLIPDVVGHTPGWFAKHYYLSHTFFIRATDQTRRLVAAAAARVVGAHEDVVFRYVCPHAALLCCTGPRTARMRRAGTKQNQPCASLSLLTCMCARLSLSLSMPYCSLLQRRAQLWRRRQGGLLPLRLPQQARRRERRSRRPPTKTPTRRRQQRRWCQQDSSASAARRRRAIGGAARPPLAPLAEWRNVPIARPRVRRSAAARAAAAECDRQSVAPRGQWQPRKPRGAPVRHDGGRAAADAARVAGG